MEARSSVSGAIRDRPSKDSYIRPAHWIVTRRGVAWHGVARRGLSQSSSVRLDADLTYLTLKAFPRPGALPGAGEGEGCMLAARWWPRRLRVRSGAVEHRGLVGHIGPIAPFPPHDRDNRAAGSWNIWNLQTSRGSKGTCADKGTTAAHSPWSARHSPATLIAR